MSDDRRPSARRIGLHRPDTAPAGLPAPKVVAPVATYQVLLPEHEYWPPVAGVPGRRVLVAVGGIGLVAAFMLPGAQPGLGWLVSVLVAVGGIGWAAWRRCMPRGWGWWRARWERVGWAVLAVALAAVTVLRAADWLCVLALVAALVAATLAVTGGRRWRELAFALVGLPLAGIVGLAWVARGLRTTRGGDGRLVAAVVAGVVLLVVFGSLFAGADAGFARLLLDAVPKVDAGSVFWSLLVFAVAGLGSTGACYLLVSRPLPRSGAARTPLRRVEWALPVGLLVVLFAVFVGVQVVAMFGGSGYVSRTPGLTYARYARGGFWQLSAVTVLTLLVIWGAVRCADRDRDRGWLRGLVGALAVLTLVIVVSALLRMWSYQQAYGFTVLRLLVETCEVWLGVIYLLIIVAGVRMRPGWVPRAAVALAMVALLGLGVLNPEGFIARHNIERWQATGRLDGTYLAGLSSDAIGAVLALPEPAQGCVLVGIARRLGSGDWRSFNVSRVRGRAELAGHGPACGE